MLGIKEVLKLIYRFQLMPANFNTRKLRCPRGSLLIVLAPQRSVLVIVLYQKTGQKGKNKQKKRSDQLVVFIASSVN